TFNRSGRGSTCVWNMFNHQGALRNSSEKDSSVKRFNRLDLKKPGKEKIETVISPLLRTAHGPSPQYAAHGRTSLTSQPPCLVLSLLRFQSRRAHLTFGFIIDKQFIIVLFILMVVELVLTSLVMDDFGLTEWACACWYLVVGMIVDFRF
ncbi:hypothetical protein CCACVL1_05701, partial [Corchorus capsularis]